VKKPQISPFFQDYFIEDYFIEDYFIEDYFIDSLCSIIIIVRKYSVKIHKNLGK
jgi:hypothetical protein